MKLINKEKFTRLPDAILLDTDNTLYPYDPAHQTALQAVKEKASKILSISTVDFEASFNEAKKQIKSQLGNTASSHSRLLYMQRTFEILGLGSQVLLSLDLEQTYWRTFLNNAVLFDEVKEFLDDIRLLNIPIAIVTDLTAQIQFRKIVFFELDQTVDYIVTSEEAGFDKPDEAPFKLALEKLQPKDNCIWMIGDDSESDICGAKDKISAITLQKVESYSKIGTDGYLPDLAFKEFKELRALIKTLDNDAQDSD